MFSAEELATRRKLWVALSELFLDTDTRRSFPWIVSVLHSEFSKLGRNDAFEQSETLSGTYSAVGGGVPWEQIEAILFGEVAPAVGHNLFDVAGDWAGFPEEWLVTEITSHLANKRGMLDKMQSVAIRTLLRPALNSLKRMHNSYPLHLELLSSQDSDLTQAHRSLSALASLYLEKDWSRSTGLWGQLKQLNSYSQKQLDQCWNGCIVDSLEPLLSKHNPSDPTPKQARKNWLWLQNFRLAIQELDLPEPQSGEWSYDLCEQLDYLFSVPELSTRPRWPMMLARLNELGLSSSPEQRWRQTVLPLLGQLSELHQQHRKNVEKNWAKLCQHLNIDRLGFG